jgi:hypothetical protein
MTPDTIFFVIILLGLISSGIIFVFAESKRECMEVAYYRASYVQAMAVQIRRHVGWAPTTIWNDMGAGLFILCVCRFSNGGQCPPYAPVLVPRPRSRKCAQSRITLMKNVQTPE